MGVSPVGTVLHTLKLLLPALVPSWRFFDVIAPSPRIEYTLIEAADDTPENWQEFQPRPENVSIARMLKRMLWNPRWNEQLFLMSCAERLMAHPTEHSESEILNRIGTSLTSKRHETETAPYIQFRLVFLLRQGDEIHKRITYTSRVYQYREGVFP